MQLKKVFHSVASILMMALLTQSCSSADGDIPKGLEDGGTYTGDGYTDKAGEGGGSQSGNTQAGIVTAGEWNDLQNWDFWSDLMLEDEFSSKSAYWHFYTNNRIAMRVTDSNGEELAGVPVKLLRETDDGYTTLWEAVTDNHGLAECWSGLFQQESVDPKTLRVSIDGQLMEQPPLVSMWNAQQPHTLNDYVVTPQTIVDPCIDIAFVVDATGSMGDEIDFLKSDLVDIISKASAIRPTQTMRTAALFYRDTNDEYVTRYTDFTEKLSVTAAFVNQQCADGGGDYPEAVHTALEVMLQNLSWGNMARTRLAFLVLDAPAHYKSEIISSLQQSVKTCAQLGIRLIPVAASGVDKNTEFMLRFFAIATGGTYVFITNDSGVGEEHIAASVGDYKVEQLNDLIIRLIGYYTE